MTAADLVKIWLEDRGYNLGTEYLCISGRLHWVRPPRGPGVFLWFKDDNTSLVVSQNIDVHTDMQAKTYNIGDPELFEHLGGYFPHDTRYRSTRTDGRVDHKPSDPK